jgi:DNA-binding CsgD family transcriptional regulator
MDIFTKFFNCYYQESIKLNSFESILEPLHNIMPFEAMYIGIIDNSTAVKNKVTIHKYVPNNKKNIILKFIKNIEVENNLEISTTEFIKQDDSEFWKDDKFISKIDNIRNDYNQRKLFIGIYGDFNLSSEYRKLVLCLLPSLFVKISNTYFDKTLPTLTKREKEVLYWIKEGKSAWDTGKLLAISEPTITFHLKNIYKKLEVVNRPHAVAKAISYGLIEF